MTRPSALAAERTKCQPTTNDTSAMRAQMLPPPMIIPAMYCRDGRLKNMAGKCVPDQRREPAAGDVRFVSEPIGWLPFAAPSGSMISFPFYFLKQLENGVDSPVDPCRLLEHVSSRENDQQH